MIPVCAGCGAPPVHRLTLSYRYPRPEFEPLAVDQWFVQGSAPLRSCGSPACGASALLATMDEIVTDAAVELGHLLDPADIDVLHVGEPGSVPILVVENGDES